jgi:hypothetical protein
MWFQKLGGQVVTNLPAVPYPRAKHSLPHVQRVSSQASSQEGFCEKKRDTAQKLRRHSIIAGG